MSSDRNYEDDEVRAIIERALHAQPAGGVSHDDLLAIGAGVGLSRTAIESAAQEVQEARLNAAATSRVVARRRRAVAAHAFVFFVLNACLFAVNFLTTPGEWWVLFPVIVWGLALVLHAGFGFSSAVSPRRLDREKRRLQQGLLATSASAFPERRIGVRVQGPLDQIEDPDAAEAQTKRSSHE